MKSSKFIIIIIIIGQSRKAKVSLGAKSVCDGRGI